MQTHDELWKLEERLWEASAAGDGEMYRESLVEEAILIFPSPTGVLDKERCIAGVIGNRTSLVRYSLEDRRVVELSEGSVLLTYRGVAAWQGSEREARDLRGSVFVKRSGSWKMAFHQVTPLR
jgi:hypothetical protein